MGKFTRTVEFETTFDGDVIAMTLQRLKRGDMMDLSQFMGTDAKGQVTMRGDVAEMYDVLSKLFPERVSNFSGCSDADGTQLAITDILDEMYFLPLVIDIIRKLFEISSVSEENEKNLG